MHSDNFAIRVVIVALAVIAIGGGAALTWLSIDGQPIPDQLDRYFTAAIVGLIGLLGRTSSASDTQQVEVVNQPAQPVPVESTD